MSAQLPAAAAGDAAGAAAAAAAGFFGASAFQSHGRVGYYKPPPPQCLLREADPVGEFVSWSNWTQGSNEVMTSSWVAQHRVGDAEQPGCRGKACGENECRNGGNPKNGYTTEVPPTNTEWYKEEHRIFPYLNVCDRGLQDDPCGPGKKCITDVVNGSSYCQCEDPRYVGQNCDNKLSCELLNFAPVRGRRYNGTDETIWRTSYWGDDEDWRCGMVASSPVPQWSDSTYSHSTGVTEYRTMKGEAKFPQATDGCTTPADPANPDPCGCINFEARTAAIHTACCGDESCPNGPPATCDAGCAELLLPFVDNCLENTLPWDNFIAQCRHGQLGDGD